MRNKEPFVLTYDPIPYCAEDGLEELCFNLKLLGGFFRKKSRRICSACALLYISSFPKTVKSTVELNHFERSLAFPDLTDTTISFPISAGYIVCPTRKHRRNDSKNFMRLIRADEQIPRQKRKASGGCKDSRF